MKTLQAQSGKIFAYKNQSDEIVYLGSTLYLGINDDGSRYFEVDEASIHQEEPNTEEVTDVPQEN